MLRLSGNSIHAEIFLLSASELFLWSDDLSVPTQDVDEQHKELIDLINQLYVAINENHGKDTSREILDQLIESMQAHFLFEESLMRLTHYVDYAAHKEQHEALMEQMRALQGKLDKETAAITVELLHFHKNWWSQHIRSSDRNFSTHYEQSGLAQHAGGTPKDADTKQNKPAWWKFW